MVTKAGIDGPLGCENGLRGTTLRILIITDAWFPQVNGVVRTFSTTVRELERMGHEVRVVSPGDFPTIPCPTYPEIRLSFWLKPRIWPVMRDFRPTAVHIAAEGTLGLATRLLCARRRIPFTTSYATHFPDYLHARFRLPRGISFSMLRWFHRPSKGVMVATDTLKRELAAEGFVNLVRWTRGVDVDLFRPREKSFLKDGRPILMYVGRVAVEKNLEAFLDLDVDGTKYVVGDGPQIEELKRKYSRVRFPGMKHGEELAMHYAAADVFVMPSRTETFGLVMLEALACGVPVAAYPVHGPLDVIGDSPAGALDENLGLAVKKALTIDPNACRAHAMEYSWDKVARKFLKNLSPINWKKVV
jgi:glycosyltransferase involved in cell wall biosynthesis